jgi:uncharacterized membrane protein
MDMMVAGFVIVSLGAFDSFLVKNRSRKHMFLSLCFKVFGLLLMSVGFWVVTGIEQSPASLAFYAGLVLIIACIIAATAYRIR